MDEEIRQIELANWPRRAQFEFFRGFQQPHVGLCAEVDCTRVLEELKPQGVAPFHALVWCLAAAANAVPELRQRLRGEGVVEHARVHPSVTVPTAEGGFAFCPLAFDPEWARFEAACRPAFARAAAQQELQDAAGDGWVYLSCLPWVSFSAMLNPVRGPDDCVPRITWGRFRAQGGRWTVPVNVQVHHALVDGRHLGRFYEVLAARLVDVGTT
ncbi:MAG: chloramphenicol acetyltransferase [Planctomycetota bacterium]